MSDRPSKFDRQNPNEDFPVPGKVLNDIFDAIDAANSLYVSSPLELTDTPTGKLLRLVPTAKVAVLKITATETGAGFYKGRAFLGFANLIKDGAADLSLPMGFTDPGIDNALILDPSATGGNTTSLTLPMWAGGLEVGVSTETPPRTVYMLMGGGSLPKAQYEGMIYQAGADGVGAFSWMRGYMMNFSGTNGT